MESRIRLFPTYPLALDRGDIAIGGGADGEGELVPPPLSPTLQPSYFSPASLARASADSYPCTSAGSPRPASAFGRRYPYALCWQPPPRQRLRRDTRTLLPASPTPPAPPPAATHALLPASPTPPAPAALLPRPHRGGGVRAWRYLVGSRIRLFSRISPCCGPWGYRHWGWRLAGRGNEFPLPCLPRSNHLASR